MKDKKALYLLPSDKLGGKEMIKAEIWHEILYDNTKSVVLERDFEG